MKRISERKDSAATKLILTAIPALWGLALLGLALWLSGHGSPGGTVACLLFSVGYFWFAWSLHCSNALDGNATDGGDR